MVINYLSFDFVHLWGKLVLKSKLKKKVLYITYIAFKSMKMSFVGTPHKKSVFDNCKTVLELSMHEVIKYYGHFREVSFFADYLFSFRHLDLSIQNLNLTSSKCILF